MDLFVLAIAFLTILLAAELFTNGIEWFGHKLGLAEGAVGSVLAAVGTALPETMIPLIAILVTGTQSANDIGVGAILGAPFMLATLAMFVTGVAVVVVGRGRPDGDRMPVDTAVLGHDVRYFGIAYALAVAVALVPSDVVWPRLVVAGLLIGIYVVYVRGHLAVEAAVGAADDLAPLRFQRLDPQEVATTPRLRIVTLQVVAALVLIVVGAYAFVGAVENLARSLGVDDALLALVVAPIATELPEKFNSVIWVRQGKDTLAMGNITGAMVFQATIPTVIALVFASSHWAITADSGLAFTSAIIAFASAAAIFVPMVIRHRLHGKGLLVGGLFYVAYVVLVVGRLAGAV